MAISLPLALLATCILLVINETGYDQSTQALHAISRASDARSSLNKLLQHMLDAETGQRGYLLTGDPRYLEPYNIALADVGQTMDELRDFYAPIPEEFAQMAQLGRNVQRKLAEMDLSVRMRKQGNEDAWKFVLMTDVGKEHMDAIRSEATRLINSTALRMDVGQAQVIRSLQLSRIGIAAVAAAGLLAFYLYLRQTNALKLAGENQKEALLQERDQLEQQVRDRTASLGELATHLQQVREQERGHLARELHDELGALLTAAKLDVARIKSKLSATTGTPDLLDRLQHLTETLNRGIALKRRIIEDLRPSSLTNLGLHASLEILAREFSERSGMEVATELEAVTLDESAQLTVYRLVQESLTNIGKYAQSKQVDISLRRYESHIEVGISDNGQGFDTTRVKASTHGLAGMRHRVEAAGGRLSVESTPGQGTRITGVLPISVPGASASAAH
ncbi:MAG: CHASE3 domain-containing protein [Ramlibacter sp.]|nr:CHASE3 domain-containing protein [Ramlibacter sp.]